MYRTDSGQFKLEFNYRHSGGISIPGFTWIDLIRNLDIKYIIVTISAVLFINVNEEFPWLKLLPFMGNLM